MKLTLAYENDKYALLAMRRIGCWYLKEGKGTRALREGINKAKTLLELQTLVENYDWNALSSEEESSLIQAH